MSFRRYESYRESGRGWIGLLPAHWQTRRLRTLVEIKKRIAGVEGPDVLSITQRGIRVRDTESNDGQLAESYAHYQRVEVGDFAMNHMDLLTGWVDLSERTGVTSPDYRVFSLRSGSATHPHYLLRVLQNAYSQRVFYTFGQGASHLGRWRLPTDAFQDFEVPLPPLEEQRTIAAFLDRETSKIDALVEEQRRLIELLKEKRQAVISHAVTKGLDPSAQMKDSGVEWLGDVPTHWQIRRFSHVVSIAEGQVDPREEPYSSMILVAPNHIESQTGRLLATETAAEQGADSGKYVFSNGDVIYSKIRPSLAKAVVAPFDGLCSADMYPLRGREGLGQEYLKWLLLCPGFTAWAVLESERVAMPKINREKLGELRVPIPPPTEQVLITRHIQQQVARFDELVSEADAAIRLLQERRAALISAAVTGKIDVRERATIPAEPAAA